MGLIQRMFRKGICVAMLLLSAFSEDAFAGWSGFQEVIQGSWGANADQFGILYEDTYDTFPRFTITSDAKVVVRDGVNKRLKVYSGIGTLEAIILYRQERHYTELTLADSYGFSGDFVGYGKDDVDYFYRADQKLYLYFSPTGQLIKSSATRPSELGVVKTESRAPGKYSITITYPDKSYSLTSDSYFERYVRDNYGYVYGLNSGGVWKFNQCGKEIAELIIPTKEKESLVAKNAPDQSIDFDVEYGQPVVSPGGDVYTWKKGPSKYSILKWTWVDDPNVPTGPDAPTGLTLMPSITGIYLTWTASPSDPGCVTGYEVARATSSGGVFSTVGTVNAGMVKYNDTTAATGTTYYYKVRAVAGSELSPYTSEVSGKR